MNTRKPLIGEIVLFQCNPDDTIATSNHNHDVIPAIITRVWSEVCVNLKIIPDCGPMQDRTSVTHQSANPAGYHFQFHDEYHSPELKLKHLQPDKQLATIRTMQDWLPAEKAIYAAMQEVEMTGVGELITEAVILLGKAKDCITKYALQNPE